ncbi:methyltransferase domain-containing protein, partial [Candidatus Omnitrophota bacterium]
ILSKFYGCGSPIPPLLAGRRVLDLGCGSGRDTYTIAKLVGEQGAVIGVDMTDEQLAVANQHLDYQMERFGFSRANVEFKKGYIENLQEIGIEDNSLDVVVSNCVINLSPDKPRVFAEIFRVLKPGGELYFSDIFTGRRISEEVKSDPVLYGECLGGALYIEDFRRILRQVGCLDYRVVAKRRISLDNPEIEAKAGMIDFYSMTIRAFKLDNLEDICEDYGQLAKYLGNIPNHPHQFALDAEHLFIAQKPVLVCGNTAAMLKSSRYAESFEIIGEAQTHFGPFNCAPTATKAESEGVSPGGGCC